MLLRLQVGHQVVIPRKTFVAQSANVRLLACVCFVVHL